MELIIDPGLRELYAGAWEGHSYPWLMEHYPEEWNVWVNDAINTVFPGGESLQEMCNRVQRTFARLAEEYRGKTILIFTHCTPIRTMITKWKGLPISAINDIYFPYNASVTIARYDDDGTVTIELEAYDEHLKLAGLHHENKEEKR